MTVELWMLMVATGVLASTVLAETVHLSVAYRPMETMGSRDSLNLTPTAARLKRVVANHIEGMAIFLPLVVAATLSGASTGDVDGSLRWGTTSTSALGAQVFAVSRLVHAVTYALGVPIVRSLAWFLGVGGLVMVASALF